MHSPKIYFVYIMSNRSKTLYVGARTASCAEFMSIGQESGRSLRRNTNWTVSSTTSATKMSPEQSAAKKKSKYGYVSRIALIFSLGHPQTATCSEVVILRHTIYVSRRIYALRRLA